MVNPVVDPYGLGVQPTNEDVTFYKQFAKNLAPGLLSNFMVSNKQQGAAGYVPGAVAATYGFADLASRGVQNLAMLPTKYFSPATWDKFESVPLPGAETAHKIVDETEARARDVLGVFPPDPGEIVETAGARAGLAVGSLGVPVNVPAILGRAGKIAAGVVNPLSTVGPTGKMALPAAGALIGTGAEVAANEAAKSTLAGLDTGPHPVDVLAPSPAPQAAPSPVSGPVDVLADTAQPMLVDVTTGNPVNTGLPDQKVTSLTGTSYGDVMAVAAAGLAILGGSKLAISALRRAHVDDFENITRGVAAEQEAVRQGRAGMTQADVGQPAIPGVEATDRATAKTVDSSVPLQRVVEVTAPDAATGERLATRVGNLANEGGHTARLQSFVDSGYDPKASRRYSAWGDHWRNVQAVPDDVRNRYSEAAALRDELDNRRALRGMPHNFPEVSNTDLQSRVAALMSDQDVVRLIAERAQITADMSNWLVDRGLLTQAEAARLRRAHPSFMPSANERGVIDNPLSSRDLTPFGGESTQSLKVWEADKQHIDALFRAAERNELIATVVKSVERFQTQNPQGAKLVSHYTGSGLPNTSGNTAGDLLHVTFRDNGILKNYRIHSRELHDYIEGVGQRLYVPIASEMRQLMQQATTGPLGWLIGQFRALAIATYNGQISAATRKSGTSFGYIDKAVNKATGGRFGVRGDPTALLIGQPYAIASDSMSLLAKHIGQTLRAEGRARRLVGDQAANFIADNMMRRWERSQLFERRSFGVSGSSGFGSPEVPVAARFGMGPANSADKLNNLYPDLFRRYSRLPLGNTMPMWVRVGNIAHELNQLITESHAAHYWALNRNNRNISREALTREARRLAGDAGEMGSAKWVQAAHQAVPYLTPTVQGGRRVLSSLQKHPFATSMGIVNMTLLPALAAVFTAMLHGDATMEHLVNEMNSDRSASTINIYTGPDPDKDRITLAVESALRGPYALVSSFVHDLLRVMHDSGDEGKQAVFSFLSDTFNKHISTTDANRAVTGSMSMFTPSLPPAVSAVTGMADKQLPNDWIARSLLGESVWVDNQTKRTIPGVVNNVDPITGANYNNAISDAISAFMGSLGSGVLSLWQNAGKRYAATGDVGETIAAALDTWSQNLGDSSGVGMLWGHQNPVPMRMAFVEQTERKMKVLQEAVSISNAMQLGGQVTRRGGELVTPGVGMESRIPTDPIMRELYLVVGKYGSVAAKLERPATDAKKQIDAIKSSGLPVQEQRQKINDATREYADRMTQVTNYVNTIEQLLSERTGKRIVLEQIDWKKGFDQFKDLSE